MGEDVELLPGRTFGPYEIRSRIGAGGMGEVYAATHQALGKQVAVKVLRKEYAHEASVVRRFMREGQLASRLRHPNIVDVTDVGMLDDGRPFLVMDLLEGEGLDERLEREGAIPVSELVELALPITAAIDHAHREGVLHRDLKPGNVFLSRAWNGAVVPKLLDFGISKVVDETPSAALTNNTAFMGTPRYGAPEVVQGDKATARSDQYALGVLLYEAATGERAFAEASASIVTLVQAIVSGDCKKPREIVPEIPEELERIVRRAMHVLPEDRFPSVADVGAALLDLAGDRARMSWEPVFGDRPALAATGETGIVSAPGSVSTAAVDPPTELMVREEPPSEVTRRAARVSLPSAPDRASSPSRAPTFEPSAQSGDTMPFRRSALPPAPPSVPTSVRPLVAPRAASAAPARIAGPAAPTSHAALIALVVGVVLFLATAAVGVTVARNAAKHRSSAAVPSAGSPAASFTVVVNATPPTTAIEIDGAAAGTGTLTRAFARDGKKHTMRLSAPGHESLTLEFDDKNTPPVYVVLRPARAQP